jgi:nucleoside-diphosphate-sugar epimerase
VNELANAVARAMGVEPAVIHLPARTEVWNAYSSHEKVESVFGPRQKHGLEAGLERMARWVRQHGSRESQPFGKIEVRKNFPLAWLS